jgi:phosphatidylinositol dimannoside acyltransferase
VPGPGDEPGESPFAYYLYRGLFAVGRYAPRPVGRAMTRMAGEVSYRLMRSRRELMAAHQRRIAGGTLDGDELARRVRAAFLSYAYYWLDSARAPGASAAGLEANTSAQGLDHLDDAVAAGRGAILALPHLGTWDTGGAWLASTGYPLTVVAELLRPRRLFEWFVTMRRRLGIDVVPLGPDAASAVARTLRRGGVVALVSDRDLVGNGAEVELFGERIRLPAGPATLAIRTGAALLPAAVYLTPGGGLRAVVRPPVPVERSGRGLRADVAGVTRLLAAEMEELIRAAPEQWHMFQPLWASDPGYGS